MHVSDDLHLGQREGARGKTRGEARECGENSGEHVTYGGGGLDSHDLLRLRHDGVGGGGCGNAAGGEEE